MFNIEGCAERVEVVPACRGAFAQAEEPVGERLAARHWARTNGAFNGALRQDGADPYWAGALRISQKAPGVGGCLAVVNADKNPTGGAIDRHEQVAAGRLVGHPLPDR